ncbi:MAG: Nif11 family protein [Lachnospiraceae bacterium]|jgi:predicted ribosomally synthesized peptide with nif11-like leader|nr:Nif11 family protein [Lachnospiraceae bacterium]MCI1727408.1 Nif11 family protein [Lachnospiraceae bacterium]
MSKKEKISELLSNSELVERLKACTNPEEIKDIAKENGLDINEDESKQALEAFSSEEGELDLSELKNVAGGGAGMKC